MEIQNIVKELLLRADINRPPINVKKIAQMLKAEIHEERFEEDDAISGVLIQDKNKVIIGINSGHSKTRQRFTIAHEIGHLLLHSHSGPHVDKILPSLVRLRDDISSLAIDEDEIESNTFAAELLMPDFMLRKDFRELTSEEMFDEADIDKLAEQYKVSIQAMTYRLINLGLIASHTS